MGAGDPEGQETRYHRCFTLRPRKVLGWSGEGRSGATLCPVQRLLPQLDEKEPGHWNSQRHLGEALGVLIGKI